VTAKAHVEELADLFKPREVTSCLFKVMGVRLLERIGAGFVAQRFERPEEQLFGAIEVLEFVLQDISEVMELHRLSPLDVCRLS
jgi:hypothetical protein